MEKLKNLFLNYSGGHHDSYGPPSGGGGGGSWSSGGDSYSSGGGDHGGGWGRSWTEDAHTMAYRAQQQQNDTKRT